MLPAAEMPVGTVVTFEGETFTKTDRPGRCPWRRGPGVASGRFVASWSVQQRINDGAEVSKPR